MRIFLKKTILPIWALVAFWFLCIGVSAGLAGDSLPVDFPFQPGEKLIYKLRWGIFTAGEAELEVLPFTEVNGERVWHFRMSAHTTEFIDVFYKVRDRIESFTDLALANSLLYNKKQREGSIKRDVVVHFNQASRTAVYSNRGEALEPIKIDADTLDPLASLYYIRTRQLAKNSVIVRPVTDGKKLVDGMARVVKRETVVIEGTEYNTFLVEPDLKDARGVFEKSSDSKLKLWITDDDRRLLVKMESKVVVGSFNATLVEVIRPGG
ncbi:MAG: DUF3108 domain-containing protein [Desulfurivibrionaceae bacterium]